MAGTRRCPQHPYAGEVSRGHEEILKLWVYSHRNHLPVPFILLALLGVILTGKNGFFLPLHIGGWLLITVGETLRVWSVGYAGATTRSMKLRAERLVTWGPYAWVRNPIYLGNFLLGLGFCLLAGVWWVFPLYLIYFGIQYSAIISLEEGFLREKFGGKYEAYSARIPRFFPRLSGFHPVRGSDSLPVRFNHRNLSGEYWTILGILCMGAVLEALKFSLKV